MTWRNLPAGKSYKWMLVSSHLFAHHAKFRGLNKKIPKLVYAHTPARYIWTPELDQRGRSGIARVGSRALKPLDKRRASGGRSRSRQTASSFETESETHEDESDAHVLYPPVDTKRIRAVEDWTTRLLPPEAAVIGSLPA